jgi:hypothetical protein
MNSKVRYMYVRDASWEPVGCVAIRVNRDENRVEYGLSVRNPVDAMDNQGRRVKFDRKTAQRIATNRLGDGLNRAYISSNATQHDISKAVMGDIIASGKSPTRAVRFAKYWIDTSELLFQ